MPGHLPRQGRYGEYQPTLRRLRLPDHFLEDEIEAIERIEIETGKRIEKMRNAAIFPANLYIASKERLNGIIRNIEDELYEQ